MPIKHAIKTKLISDEDFHALDYEVMGLVFSVHRELGRLWNEKIYQNELAYHCQKAGVGRVEIEVPIQVTYEGFQKSFYVDMVFDDAAAYELKVVPALTGDHHQQTLHYLFLLGMQHGKLVNFHPASVESRFVSTRLTFESRYDFAIDDQSWLELDEDSLWLRQIINGLLKEWGAFLDTNLFYEAIKHFRGGEEYVVKKIEVMNGEHVLGRQKIHLLNPDVAFKITSITKDEKCYENHLRQFLCHTTLKAIQWINFNHDQIVCKTIVR